MQEYSVEVALVHPDDMVNLFGSNERHLKLIEENLDVVIHARTERVQILGETEEAIELARLTIKALLVLVGRGMIVNTSDVVTALSMAQNGNIDKFVALYEEEIIKDNTGKPIRVKTLGQKLYVICSIYLAQRLEMKWQIWRKWAIWSSRIPPLGGCPATRRIGCMSTAFCRCQS